MIKLTSLIRVVLLLFFIFAGISLVFSQDKEKSIESKGDMKAYQEIHQKRITELTGLVDESLKKIAPFIPKLEQKYPDKKIHYYINQYPFSNPDKKYWKKREEAVLTIEGGKIKSIQFIVEDRQDYGGNGFQKTFIYDNTPADASLDDLVVDFKDFILPQDNYKLKVGEITDLRSKVMVLELFFGYYARLARSIENDYYSFLIQQANLHQKMLGTVIY